jgi:hypothetical protein
MKSIWIGLICKCNKYAISYFLNSSSNVLHISNHPTFQIQVLKGFLTPTIPLLALHRNFNVAIYCNGIQCTHSKNTGDLYLTGKKYNSEEKNLMEEILISIESPIKMIKSYRKVYFLTQE